MSRTYTVAEVVNLLGALERNLAHLIGVANIDVGDVFGEDAAKPRAMFLVPKANCGDTPTIYALRLARMLVDRLVQEYDIVPLGSVDPSPAAPESPADQAGTTGTENHENGSEQ